MTESLGADWDPRSADVLADQIAVYDQMRATCPVAHDANGQWSVFRHDDVVRILRDHDDFSNAVSVHVAVPNGMDPPQHTAYRAVIDRYYTPERMARLEPQLRGIATELIAGLERGAPLEVMSELAEPFAMATQNEFMGWPNDLAAPLIEWNKRNHAAILSQDRERISAVALEFDGHIREQLEAREGTVIDDVTAELMRETVNGRRLTDTEIVAIIRNWTVGELGTMAASFGIIVDFLAEHPEVQAQLRANPDLAEQASDEILRIHAPLISNRRRTTRTVVLGNRDIPADERVSVVWASANRDESVFGDPDEFRLDRDPEANLLYGKGIHACPGAPLARLEFRVFLEVLLAQTSAIQPVPEASKVRAVFPGSGWSQLSVTLV